MIQFIKKDLLLFLRDRKELITILTLPILLVVVLNYAFSGLLGDRKDQSMDLHLAVVNQDHIKNVTVELKERLIKEAALSEKEANQTIKEAANIRPVSDLLTLLNSKEIGKWVTVHQLEEKEAIKKLKTGDVDGILVIPNGFTADNLYAAITKEAPKISFIYKIDQESSNNRTLYNIIEGIMDQLNIQFISQQMMKKADVKQPIGGFEHIGSGKSFTLKQYYTITMAILFALFLSATIAIKTDIEIRQQVLNRILLTNSHPILFLIGKMVAAFCLSWLQMMFLFVLSNLILDAFPDHSPTFWFGVIGIISLFSLAVAGFAAIFTVICLKITNLDATNGISMFVIMLFGILGGNFVPIYVLPNWLQQVGELTPNGLALVMFTEWIQFETFSSLFIPSIFLVAFFLLCTMISVALYPKRGRTA